MPFAANGPWYVWSTPFLETAPMTEASRLAFLLAASLTCALQAQSGCLEPHQDPGCDDPECEAAVCNEDPFCCEVTWDSNCVDIAKQVCEDDNGGGGGGGDDALGCADAQVIGGTGDFPFDNTTADATIDLTGTCDPGPSGNDILYKSVWFRWTCPQDDTFVFSTCNQAAYNTRIAIFEGSCDLETILTCLDDTPGCGVFTTEVVIDCDSGTEYLVCVGSYAPFLFGSATLSIDPAQRKLVGEVAWPTDLGAPEDTIFEAWEPPGGLTDWAGCRDDALKNGEDLVTIGNSDENEAVTRLFAQFGSGYQAFGLYQDLGSPDYAEPAGGWGFSSGAPLTYTNWGPGEPNDTGNSEHVGQLGAGGAWNDLDGTLEEWNGYATRRPGTPFRHTWSKASGGNDHEYEAFALPVEMTVLQAHVYAKQRGGYLVAINSSAEQSMLNQFVIDACFSDDAIAIGLVQDTGSAEYAEPGGGWIWSSGEPVLYTNWNTGEPNDSPVGENFGEMFASGRWNDLQSSSIARAVIIEYPAERPDCPEDLDGDGSVGGADLTLLLGLWGQVDASADLDGSGTVDGGDLTIMLGAWGSCS